PTTGGLHGRSARTLQCLSVGGGDEVAHPDLVLAGRCPANLVAVDLHLGVVTLRREHGPTRTSTGTAVHRRQEEVRRLARGVRRRRSRPGVDSAACYRGPRHVRLALRLRPWKHSAYEASDGAGPLTHLDVDERSWPLRWRSRIPGHGEQCHEPGKGRGR